MKRNVKSKTREKKLTWNDVATLWEGQTDPLGPLAREKKGKSEELHREISYLISVSGLAAKKRKDHSNKTANDSQAR
jgi:hypothetical protein